MKTMDEKIKRPVLPEVETTDYEAQAEAQIAEAKRLAEQQEKRAKRDRDMAIFGDIANMVSKGAAMHGGAWKINKDEPMATKGNERLRALQESNSKQMAEYAKLRVAAQDANRKQRNAINEARYNADLAAYKDAVEAEKYAKEQERKDREEERKDRQEDMKAAETASTIAKNNAYTNYYNSGGRRTGGSTSNNNDVFIYNADGTKTEFKRADTANNVQAAYNAIIQIDPNYKVQKMDYVYTTDMNGRPVYELNVDGTRKTVLVDANPKEITLQMMRDVIERYNADMLSKMTDVVEWKPEEDDIIDYVPNK